MIGCLRGGKKYALALRCSFFPASVKVSLRSPLQKCCAFLTYKSVTFVSATDSSCAFISRSPVPLRPRNVVTNSCDFVTVPVREVAETSRRFAKHFAFVDNPPRRTFMEMIKDSWEGGRGLFHRSLSFHKI